MAQTFAEPHFFDALPYRARAKAIESIIRVFGDQYISQIDGYLGSDRLAKPTETLGRPPKPFSGTMQALFGKISEAIDLYNSMPQGALGGQSPNDVWQTAIGQGWRPNKIDPETLTETLVRIVTRTVRQGFIKIDNSEFSCDALCRSWALEKENVTVHIPLFEDMPPSVYAPDGQFVGLVYSREWQTNDRRGAREASRLKQLRHQGARELERAAPPVDVEPYQQRWLARHGPPDEAPAGNLIELHGQRGKAATARRALPAAQLKEGEDRLEAQMRLLRDFSSRAGAAE